jgi:predicted transcriptional regulator
MTDALDEDSRYIEDFAEISKIPVETMRRIMTATYDELAAWQQTLDSEHPDDQRIFLAIMFGRAWRDFFSSR